MVDALSRRPTTLSLMSISSDWRSHLLVEHSKDKFACELLDGQIQDDRYRVIDDIIYYKNRIFLVLESPLKNKILQASYDSPLARHQGFLKTYRQIRERFSWKGLKKDVIQHVRECSLCQQNKIEQIHPTGLLLPYRFPSRNGRAFLWTSLLGCPRSKA